MFAGVNALHGLIKQQVGVGCATCVFVCPLRGCSLARLQAAVWPGTPFHSPTLDVLSACQDFAQGWIVPDADSYLKGIVCR